MQFLPYIPLLPLLGFLILFITEGRLNKISVALIGAGSVGIAVLIALLVGIDFYNQEATPYSHQLWTWMSVGDFQPNITLYLDPLAMVMTGVITGVGFLIHTYATGYMWEEDGYSRFFAYMNLFVFAMLMLVLGDNLLVLFLGWEGVGLCSYLLIGFFHTEPENGYAARKAFVVTRVGDTFMALGLFLLFREVGTLEIQSAVETATTTLWPDGSTMNTAICLLLLGGAIGKSAQVPLQTWLPDAMAGPTPVSALIHAATMVTAGVYLVARMQGLYLLDGPALDIVAVVGLLTLVIASFTALVQTDIKRILAFSTMSQIGYMFFALGVGAWSAGIFHLMTHAFFKALLFLASGSVILALHHEQNIFKMGGLAKKLPVPFWSMAIGSAALAALPLTSGFFSKDAILITSEQHSDYGLLFWAVAVLAAFMTSLYTMRMMMVTFFGELKTEPHDHSKANMWMPLLVLCALSIVGGWFGFEVTEELFADKGMKALEFHFDPIALITMLVPIAGVILGYYLFRPQNRKSIEKIANSAAGHNLSRFFFCGWGFDWLYDQIVVKPFVAIAKLNKSDMVDSIYKAITAIMRYSYNLIVITQNGSLRWYVLNMSVGLAAIALLVVFVL
ncbi:MAG: NADH-quinone oxidoreductase subunit L [Gammaproteobacteria bacterium]|nr:NADH-quinone oxidoreductase subunit L [Gammaproteobacteria bacterium]